MAIDDIAQGFDLTPARGIGATPPTTANGPIQLDRLTCKVSVSVLNTSGNSVHPTTQSQMVQDRSHTPVLLHFACDSIELEHIALSDSSSHVGTAD